MKNKESRISYVCGVDFQHEIGETDDIILYSSIEALKSARQCWKNCGIVELEIKVKKWVEPQDFKKPLKKEK